MKFLSGLLVGLVLGGVAYWFVEQKAREHPEAEHRFETSASEAGAAASDAAHHLSEAFKAELQTLDLRPEEIKDEMARTGKVVRHKAQEVTGQVEDAATEARIVTEIKAKFAKDPDLSVWSISVSCNDGHVTLSGTVPNAEGVGRAIALALEVKGVADVTSTLQIKPK